MSHHVTFWLCIPRPIYGYFSLYRIQNMYLSRKVPCALSDEINENFAGTMNGFLLLFLLFLFVLFLCFGWEGLSITSNAIALTITIARMDKRGKSSGLEQNTQWRAYFLIMSDHMLTYIPGNRKMIYTS